MQNLTVFVFSTVIPGSLLPGITVQVFTTLYVQVARATSWVNMNIVGNVDNVGNTLIITHVITYYIQYQHC